MFLLFVTSRVITFFLLLLAKLRKLIPTKVFIWSHLHIDVMKMKKKRYYNYRGRFGQLSPYLRLAVKLAVTLAAASHDRRPPELKQAAAYVETFL